MANFLDYWMDSEYRQRDDIERASADVADAQLSIEQLREIVANQRRDLFELKTSVAILIRLLDERNVVESAVVRASVASEIERITAAARPENRQVMCTRCRRTVLASKTDLTGDGPVCDACVR